NDSKGHAKPTCKVPDESIPKELSKVMGVSLGPSPTSLFLTLSRMNVQEKQKKKKKLLKSKSIQNSDLPEILVVGFCQNFLLDISHNLIASIKKYHIESEESIHESEKLFALNTLH
ncbi:1502_t:CDS:1, partial [Dentiscutata heterogama]